MIISLNAMPLILLALQQAQEPPEVKYNVALIAAIASVLAAIIAALFTIANSFISRSSQRKLQQQQAELTSRNQTELASLQSQLTLQTQTALEVAKSSLTERAQTKLESLKSELGVRNQEHLELLRSQLDEQGRERNARRDYEYDAIKRLYAECEPLLFQLAELSENAYHRIQSLARTARQGKLTDWLGDDGYYLRSTMYNLICPLVIFRIIRQRLTFVDLTLDDHIASQYGLLKLLYLTFTDSFEFAKIAPVLKYDPDVNDWKAKVAENEAKYRRQGLPVGYLDNSIDALIISSDDGRVRWKTYGEFDREIRDPQSLTREHFGGFADVLIGFHPRARPVLWRMLWTQTLIYQKIIESQSTSTGTASRIGLADISPRIPVGGLDWRQSPAEASDEDVLQTPELVAREYLSIRLPKIFGTTPESGFATPRL